MTKISEQSFVSIGLVLTIGALVFACGIAYAQFDHQKGQIVEIKAERKSDMKRMSRMERVLIRMAEKQKVEVGDLYIEE